MIKNQQAMLNNLSFKGVDILTSAGVPTTDGATKSGKGSLCIDTTNGKLYINTGTKATPTWTVVGTQA